MLHDFLLQLATLLISFAITVLVPFFISLVGNLSKNSKYKSAILLAETVVKSVEQTMIGCSGAEKKRAVEIYLANKLKGVTVDDIDHLVESAVYALKQAGVSISEPGITETAAPATEPAAQPTQAGQ